MVLDFTTWGVGYAFLYIMRKREEASRLDILAMMLKGESTVSTYPLKSLVDNLLRNTMIREVYEAQRLKGIVQIFQCR